jgi:hypothetical protein
MAAQADIQRKDMKAQHDAELKTLKAQHAAELDTFRARHAAGLSDASTASTITQKTALTQTKIETDRMKANSSQNGKSNK